MMDLIYLSRLHDLLWNISCEHTKGILMEIRNSSSSHYCIEPIYPSLLSAGHLTCQTLISAADPDAD